MNLVKNNLLWMMIAVALVMTSCNRQVIYSHYEPVPIDGWDREEPVVFCIRPVAETGTYTELFGLRASSIYPFTHLTLLIKQQIYPSGKVKQDMVSIQLTDEEGFPKGTGMNHFQYELPPTTITLQEGDSLQVTISHYMKREHLPGITDIGLTLEKNED